MISIIEAIEEYTLQLFTTVNRFRFKINVLVEGIIFYRANKLLCHKISISGSVVASFHKVCNMLARVSYTIELLEFLWLIILKNLYTINLLKV